MSRGLTCGRVGTKISERMGIYDREYYRDQTSGSPWLTGATPVTVSLVVLNAVVFVAQTMQDRTDCLRYPIVLTQYVINFIGWE